MIRFTLILIIIIKTNFVYSQNIKQTRELALNHYENKNYLECAKLLNRVIFFQNKKTSSDIIITADCYEKLNKDNLALYYYNLGFNISSNDSVKICIDINRAKIFIKQEKYFESIKILLAHENTEYEFLNRRVSFLLGTSYFFTDDFSKSEKYFSKILDENDKLEIYFKEVRKKYPNPNTAFWLSTAFPGLGQLYLKDYWDGLNSLLLNSMLGAVFFITAKESSILNASISITPWLHRYLTGGSENARNNANSLIKEKNKNILKEIISEFN